MPSKTILHCDEALKAFWPLLVRYIQNEYPGYRLRVVESHVPPEEQLQRFHKGRNGLDEIVDEKAIITEADGTRYLTPHNHFPSRAVLFSLIDDHGYACYEPHVLNSVGTLVRKHGLVFVAPDTIIHWVEAKS